MSGERVVDAVLRTCADQRTALPHPVPDDGPAAFGAAVRSYTAFMRSEHAEASRWGRVAVESVAAEGEADAVVALLAGAVLALAASADPGLDDSAVSLELPGLAAAVDPDDPVGGFGRYVACEAALANARLGLAAELVEVGRPPRELWAGHPYVGVMLACDARVAAFGGNITLALSLLEGAAPEPGVVGSLVRATHALAAGNAADLPRMRFLVGEVESADVPPADRLGRGVHLLLAFSEIALGDVDGAVGHLLRAGGGAELEHLTIIDRALGYELLVVQALAEDDLESALAWQQLAEQQAGHRAAAPVAHRLRSRIATLVGDLETAEAEGLLAVETAAHDGRRVEVAEGEMVLAAARLAGRKIPDATRRLRDAVVVADSTGHGAVRHAAAKLIRPTRRRLPPVTGAGRDTLSPRERDITDLIAAGETNAAIAARLHLSETTVRTHVTRILTAHGVATRTGLLARLHALPAEPRRPADLTPRQGEVAALIASGRGNTEIAAELAISLKSVETHISSIRDRWQASSRFDVASRWWALQLD